MVLLCTLIFVAAASAGCYEASIAHPLPDLEPNDAVLTHAFAAINTELMIVLAAPEFASTSLSIEITSSKESLWSYHHTALERNASRPDIPAVNGDALYRIASITKTFTVLGILYQHQAGNLSLDDPVDNYIKELKEDQDGTIPWKDITLRSLASQLSGIPRDCILTSLGQCYTEKVAQGDYINVCNSGLADPLEVGLPPVSRKGLIDCDEYSPNFEKPCAAKDLLDAVMSKRPLFAPNMKSTYSNIAFELLGLILERVTKKTYEQYITDAIFKPLGMSKSSLSLPPDSAGVIPLNPQAWNLDLGIQSPTGAIYSSTTDLSKYLRYILSHYNAIAMGVNWINPVSPSEGLNSFYGMPWEILQTDRILKDSRRTVRFISKSGGLPGYTSVIATVPEFDLGITILVAGKPDIFPKILDAVGAPLIRAAEEVAIRQLQERYVGTYTSTNHNLNSTITLVADSRGLVVKRFISNYTNVLDSIFKGSRGPWYAQLTPTLLFHDEKKQQGELWRMVQSNKRAKGEGSIWDDLCVADIDPGMYAGMPSNELAFWSPDQDGKFETVELSAFRVNLTRTEEPSVLLWDEVYEILEL